ncbi:MAG: dehydrogenase, short-chain alcohol dehydrogenase like protein [Actinomycetia bacterium]|jgi:NAD(P)-dependent dehydrogenase (short-subunit alcohol dehydrogenase family)|nr:dehydrogenase, short-chain alcohol dehydrogenase like protein [Actinomycetes bacterium]
MDLAGAGVVVTGGASGIGAATVSALHDAGARVAVLDLASESDADVHRRVDIGDEAAVVDAVASVAAELGGLDAAVLNAGIGGSGGLLDLTTDEWDRVMRVNLRGAFVSLRECGRAMRNAQRAGSIVVITSVSGFLADTRMAHYSVSKAGAAQLVRVAARELGPLGIRVNGVAPGTTDTPMFAATEQLPGYRERVASRAALGRVGTAAEVAQAVVALLTLDWVTGQIVAADGGVSLFSPIDPAESLRGPGR